MTLALMLACLLVFLSYQAKDPRLMGQAINSYLNAGLDELELPLYQDYLVPPYYDSLLGKLIVHGVDRDEAVRKMQTALSELVIDGVTHTAELQMDILEDPRFLNGRYTTEYMENRE